MGLAVRSWRWLHAAKVVFIVRLWGAIVLLLPHLINQLPQRTSETSMLTWTVLSIFILMILYQISGAPHSHSGNITPTQRQSADWTILKAVTVASAVIGLGLMSIINFAAAQIGAMLLVPLCLIVHPLKHMGQMKILKAVLLLTCNLALAILGFPPAALFILKVSSEGFGGLSVGDFCLDGIFMGMEQRYLLVLGSGPSSLLGIVHTYFTTSIVIWDTLTTTSLGSCFTVHACQDFAKFCCSRIHCLHVGLQTLLINFLFLSVNSGS